VGATKPSSDAATRLALGPRWLYPAKAVATTARSLAWAVRARGHEDRSGVRILFYHRVSRDRDELAVTPERFAEQMGYLADRGYRVVDTLGAVEALDAPSESAPVIGLNFDDGYLDVAEHALPVLREHGFQATVFVATGVTDGRASFGWYARMPPLMGWDVIRELDREGVVRFEPHTINHPNLPLLAEAEAREEIEGSKRELEERLGRTVDAFCYPAGLFGERERRLVASAGFGVAVSTEPGVNRPDTDRLALRRRQVDARDRLLDFRAKVAGAHDAPPRLRAVYRRVRYGTA
jgi:peptidoglycan/xylan/chitin deacetylase (PgdA/CDA1 family)